jgi:phenylalanyl-tRNA synthetase alpha chain
MTMERVMQDRVEIPPELKADYDAIYTCTTSRSLEELEVSLMGKKGKITLWVKEISSIPQEQRRDEGAKRNKIKTAFDVSFLTRHIELKEKELNAQLEAERVDVSLPARAENLGRLHPISQTIDEMIEICAQMGFTVATGPQIESDEYNFGKLNMPPDHPARQMQDTFYMPDAADGSKRVLRTHTSPVQVRTMLNQKPPIRIIAPGRVYRYDSDATHSPMFHQIEGLVIDEIGKITMAHLKGVLLDFYRAYFGVTDLPVRFRPSFFPFTEPSAEFDLGCSRKNGEIKIGNFGDWLEMGGCGMVHPNVLSACGIDPTQYQGFAFGMGIDRAAMLKYGIPDIRNFFEGDVRWMKHYGFVPLDVPSLALGSVA